ncbi:MAG: D-glycerate dehydrogenase [Firmicutes bacterium]|jgi:glyoxylate reductase|nr:D-glycerate dehydrogenase [Bacillota bacterium]
MYSVFVTRALPGDTIRRISKDLQVTVYPKDRNITKDELLTYVKDADAIISMLSDPIDADVLAAGKNLKVVANYAVGFNNIDVAAATARGIAVVNTPGVLTEATADLAWALLLAVSRRVLEGDAMTRAGKFRGWAPELLLGVPVYGQTLGIVGAGRIGRAVARRARGFGMRILYHNRSRLAAEVEQELGMAYASLDELLAESDFVSLHCPLTPETHHLIGAAELSKMKPTAVLINTARGPVVDEQALLTALRNKQIFGAGLDVYEREPMLTPGLADLPNVILTPHIGTGDVRTRVAMVDMVVDDVIAVLENRRPRHIVNPEVWERRNTDA